jgi:hypothetical protein
MPNNKMSTHKENSLEETDENSVTPPLARVSILRLSSIANGSFADFDEAIICPVAEM